MPHHIRGSGLTLVLAACLSLGACASIGTPAASTQIELTKSFIVAEQGYDTAVMLADNAIVAGSLTGAAKTRVVALIDQGHTIVVLGRTAVTAADSATLTAEIAALTALIPQITALVK